MSWRDRMCGQVGTDQVGQKLALAGWVDTRRDHGGLVFIDLRDASGLCQLVINPERAPEPAAAAHGIRNEFVLRAEGEIVRREPENVNPDLPTGEVELQVDELEILSRSTPLPFQLDEEGVDETLRLRYRWLDLRRSRMQRNLRLRAGMVSTIRRVMEGDGFLDIQTPILFKPTPEGARDFVVPSRLQRGRFFALPQSPQILKQLLVIGGFDRYYQIAICFRDEDLRADRVQEITQLDVEMAFPDQEYLFALMERMCAEVWKEGVGDEIETPFPRMTHAEAMARYGSDKPDLRFGLEIEDATEATRGSEFGVFANASTVRFIRVPQAFSRAELDRLEAFAKEWGAKGLAYLVFAEDGEVRSPIAKFLSDEELAHFRSDPGSTVFFAADEPALAARVLGALRLHLGRELGLIDDESWRFVWVTDFPMFEWDEDAATVEGRAPSVHAARGGLRGARRQRPRGRDRARVRPHRQRHRDRRRLVPDPRAGAPGGGLCGAAALRRGAAAEVRLPPGRSRDGRTAARRHRLRHRAHADGARSRVQPARHDRVPEEPGRRRPDERGALGGRGGTAAGARNSAACPAGLSAP